MVGWQPRKHLALRNLQLCRSRPIIPLSTQIDEEPERQRPLRHAMAGRSDNDDDVGTEQFNGGLGEALSVTLTFYLAVAFFLCGGDFETCPWFKNSPHAKAQVYSLVVTLWMWNRPHYRTGTYQAGTRFN